MTTPTPAAIAERRARFRQLHEWVLCAPERVGRGKCTIPRVGGVRRRRLHVEWVRMDPGERGQRPSLEDTLRHLRELVAGTSLPVNADFVDGFSAPRPRWKRASRPPVRRGSRASQSRTRTLLPPTARHAEPQRACRIRRAHRRGAQGHRRVRAGRALIGRAENFIVDRADIEDTIARLQAYSAAGRLPLRARHRQPEHITAIVNAVAPKPVNLLVWGGSPAISEMRALVFGV
jgi:hypothetical protein